MNTQFQHLKIATKDVKRGLVAFVQQLNNLQCHHDIHCDHDEDDDHFTIMIVARRKTAKMRPQEWMDTILLLIFYSRCILYASLN